ncbi:MAG: hypothetical protein Hals2KO_30020 [Halioglobus sp.]
MRFGRVGGSAVPGFALIEFLVALLIFTAVTSAMAASQLAAKRIGSDGLHRARATLLAQDILSSISANPTQLSSYLVDKAGDPLALLPEPTADCSLDPCTVEQIAAFDLWQWEQRLLGSAEVVRSGPVGGLPAARACITQVAGTVRVAISWLGLTSASESALSDCAADETGLYDAGGAPIGNNLRRRQAVLTRFLGGAS